MKTSMNVVLVLGIAFSFSACKSSSTPQASNPTNGETTTGNTAVAVSQALASQETEVSSPAYRPRIEACALLTNSEIESVQRETVKAIKLSGAPDRGFDVSQCFFTLRTFANSISLKVTQKREGNGARDPKEFWRVSFHQERQSEDERERARERAREKLADREEREESAPPIRVNGVGDEAYWMGSQVGGALYVLRGNNYLRISVGGVGEQKEKIRKSTALALKVLARLSS